MSSVDVRVAFFRFHNSDRPTSGKMCRLWLHKTRLIPFVFRSLKIRRATQREIHSRKHDSRTNKSARQRKIAKLAGPNDKMNCKFITEKVKSKTRHKWMRTDWVLSHRNVECVRRYFCARQELLSTLWDLLVWRQMSSSWLLYFIHRDRFWLWQRWQRRIRELRERATQRECTKTANSAVKSNQRNDLLNSARRYFFCATKRARAYLRRVSIYFYDIFSILQWLRQREVNRFFFLGSVTRRMRRKA